MTILTFDYALFKERFPRLATGACFVSENVAQSFWDQATLYVSACVNNCSDFAMTPAQQMQAIMLMTAHLARLSQIIEAGDTPGLVESASVDKVSVTLNMPEFQDQWSWWLNQTPYGQQLNALLGAAAVGGAYIGGRPELSAFRRVGGNF